MNKELLESLDREYRRENLEKIRELSSDFIYLKNLLKKLLEGMSYYNDDIPIPSITLNNKIVEINNLYKDAGIYMFYKNSYLVNEYPGIEPGICSSFIGITIIMELLDLVFKSKDILRESISLIDNAWNNKTFIGSFLLGLYCGCKNKKYDEVLLSKRKRKKFTDYMNLYREIDNKIYNYKIDENLVDSIVDKFIKFRVDAPEVALLVEDDIAIDLDRLGYGYLIPLLKNKLIDVYKKNIPSNTIIEDISDYIPDFDTAKEMRTIALNRYNKKDKSLSKKRDYVNNHIKK